MQKLVKKAIFRKNIKKQKKKKKSR